MHQTLLLYQPEIYCAKSIFVPQPLFIHAILRLTLMYCKVRLFRAKRQVLDTSYYNDNTKYFPAKVNGVLKHKKRASFPMK